MDQDKTINIVAWLRVSSKEQQNGYSIDAQRRAIQDYCDRNGAKVVREFSVAESAKPGAARKEFNAMLDWVRSNVRREAIGGMVFHKVDRACRNMRDAMRLKEVEQDFGVRLFFVDQQFGEGAAGQFSFNVLASVAQFYSDNLRTETLKGMDEKARQGWLPSRPPFGYRNAPEDDKEPIKPVAENAAAVARIFELYSRGDMTFELLAEKLKAEGHMYKASEPSFGRRSLSYILNNRFYIGEIYWHGRVFQGKHQPIVDTGTFQACHDILTGKNRRTSKTNEEMPLGGGLFHCQHCGQAITAEHIRRKRKNGSLRHHLYYRCANNKPGPDHPTVRWSADDLESEIVAELAKLKLPNPEVTAWFRNSLSAAMSDETEYRKRTLATLRKRESELEGMQDRLLNTHINGTINEEIFTKKNVEIKMELDRVRGDMSKEAKLNADYKDMAVTIFDLTQRAAETWKGSNNAFRRELLDVLCLNRSLDSASLCFDWRKPFDALAERPKIEDGIPSGI